MSLSNLNALNREFDSLVKHAYQSGGYKLKGSTRFKASDTSKQFDFRKMGSLTAYEFSSQTTFSYQDPGFDKVQVTAKKFGVPVIIAYYDEFINNFNERQETAMAASKAIGRRYDQIIIDALEASGTSNTIVNESANFTYDKFTQVMKYFDELSVPPEERFVAISASAKEHLMSETKFISNDYISRGAVQSGRLSSDLVGMNVILIPEMTNEGGLSKTGNIRTCWAWHKDAMGFVQTGPIRNIIERLPQQDSWQVLSTMFVNAVAIDPVGIVQIDIDETA